MTFFKLTYNLPFLEKLAEKWGTTIAEVIDNIILVWSYTENDDEVNEAFEEAREEARKEDK